ncbi:MAG TPA: endo-1,4-beta-xylanase [Terriglobales bacterium]|nr:endo-1,4-beta-xylanase [Terriglobales bacterium]
MKSSKASKPSIPYLIFTCIVLAVGPNRTLREAADHAHILIGAAARPYCLSEPAYAATLDREFNMLEPEDALKWETLRPDPQTFDFHQADQLVDFAQRHNMKVRGHTLVWHRQNPKWLTGGNYTPEQLSKFLETHIKTVVGHYKGKIFAWDVANEAFDEGPRTGEPRQTIWSGALSQLAPRNSQLAYLAQAFRWAHEADSAALLFYNEAEADELNKKSDAVYVMVRDFKRQGIPIDGVGLQMHIEKTPNIASISANIARFTALGVQVHITELDVSLPVDGDGDAMPADLEKQAETYRQIAKACLSHPGCTAIQTWGFTDKYSWIGSHSKKTRGAALPFDHNYHPKPAYQALRDALHRAQNR